MGDLGLEVGNGLVGMKSGGQRELGWCVLPVQSWSIG